MTTGGFVVYGAAGSGSVPVEAAMTLLGLEYSVVEGATWTGDAEILARVGAVNPLRQIPALVTPAGETLTESGAILTWLADRFRDTAAGPLSPGLDDPRRGQFLRWMTFVPASIYSLYWIRDDPTRLVPAELGEQVKAKTAERIADCWAMMDSQVSPGRYLLGDEMSVLDLYVAVVSRWSPAAPASMTRRPGWRRWCAASTPTPGWRPSGRRGFRSARAGRGEARRTAKLAAR